MSELNVYFRPSTAGVKNGYIFHKEDERQEFVEKLNAAFTDEEKREINARYGYFEVFPEISKFEINFVCQDESLRLKTESILQLLLSSLKNS